MDRWVRFDDCEFGAAVGITGVAVPAGTLGVTTLNGQVRVINPKLFGYALLVSGGSTAVKVLAFQNATTVQGVGASAASS